MVRREHAQDVTRPIGQQPLVERHDHVVGLLEPTRGTGVQIDQPTRRPTGQITREHGAHEGVQLEPAAAAPPGHEQAVCLGCVEQVTGISSVGQRRARLEFTRGTTAVAASTSINSGASCASTSCNT